MDQDLLWHDTMEDALRSVVHALGGPKAVGYLLWPAKSPVEAARLLNHCLDQERPEKLALEELLMLLRAGAEAGCHVGMAFIADSCSYERPRRVDPQDQRTELERRFVEAVEQQKQIVRQMERLRQP